MSEERRERRRGSGAGKIAALMSAALVAVPVLLLAVAWWRPIELTVGERAWIFHVAGPKEVRMGDREGIGWRGGYTAEFEGSLSGNYVYRIGDFACTADWTHRSVLEWAKNNHP